MYNLYRKCESFKNIVIFGAAELGGILYDELTDWCDETGKFLFFADNSINKQDGKRIFSPAEVAGKYPNAVWIIATDMRAESMFSNLRALSIPESRIITKLPKEVMNRYNTMLQMKRTTPQGILSQIDVNLTDHCNLNCAGCCTLCPLVEERYADCARTDKDLARLSKLLNKKLRLMYLTGGEPLLNRQAPDIIKSARRHFPGTELLLISNGLLLPQMKEEFWAACKENGVTITVTKYPIDFDYDTLPVLAEQHEVGFSFFRGAVAKSTCNYAFDISGSQDPYESFINCNMANRIAVLDNGRIYSCCHFKNIADFNRYFKTNLEVCQDDYIDIYAAKSGNEILQFISNPFPFCRYCNVKARTFENTWHLSERDIGEWIANDVPQR